MAGAIEYLRIRGTVLMFQSIAPLALLYTSLRLLHNLLPKPLDTLELPWPIAYWLFAEATTCIFLYLPYKHTIYQRAATHPPALPRAERQKLFTKCWGTVEDPEKYLKGWFQGAAREDIKRENLKQFIHWAFFNCEQVPPEDEEEVEGYVVQVEEHLGRKVPEGKAKAVSLRTSLDEVRCSYRSLFWYLILFLVDGFTHCVMLWNGYYFHRTSVTRFLFVFPFRPLTLLSKKRSPAKHITYWHREHKAKDQLPVLFIHGIGVGLIPYLGFLNNINKHKPKMDADIGVIAIELMAVSSRITLEAFDRDVLIEEIRKILKFHGWTKVVLVGHSYGTVISTHLLKSPETRSLIGPVVLVDPVCFMLHLPDVAYNFTSRMPKSPKEYILWYFASKDIGVAHTLHRRFFWSLNILWKEDVIEGEGHKDVTVLLSEKDDIVDVGAVRRYLNGSQSEVKQISAANGTETDALLSTVKAPVKPWRGSGLEVVWLPKLHHAQTFDFKKLRDDLVTYVQTYCRKGMKTG